MKRILLVSPFPPYIGGVSVSVQRLYEYLRHKGYDVVKFDTQISRRAFNLKPLKFIKYLGLPLYLASRKRFDVVHFHVSDIMPKYYIALWRRLFSGETRFILTIHGQVKHTLASGFGRYALEKFDRLILVRKNDTRHLPAHLRPRAVEIPAFIPPVISEISEDQFPSGLIEFLREDAFKMLINGFIIINDRFHDLYGFIDAINLLDKLCESGRDVLLVIVVLGGNYSSDVRDYVDYLKKVIAEKRLSKRVFWIENSTMELWPVLKKVNVLLRPTKSDGDALSIRESLYLKIPVITSNAVPRPQGTVVYKLRSEEDLLRKTTLLIDNYDNHVACIGHHSPDFARKIAEQYDWR